MNKSEPEWPMTDAQFARFNRITQSYPITQREELYEFIIECMSDAYSRGGDAAIDS